MNNKVLVIEDEKGIRDNIKLLLEAEKYEVTLVSGGEEGIKKAREIKPDLIICDILMPGIDGYEVIKTINGSANNKLIPFIFLTAKVERADLRKGMELGADDYIFKPYDADELTRAVKCRLDKYNVLRGIIDGDIGKNKYKANDKILFRTGNNIEKVVVENILFISAARQYTNIFIDEKKKHVVKKSLSKWEEMLPADLFIRIHRALLVNLNHVHKVEKTIDSTYKVYLHKTDHALEVSRRYFKNLKRLMKMN
ncbi:MAG: response regulator [Ignavibacteriales bacterium]|nr:response regulator [Ignavibacteriales bacterium]